MPVRPPFDPTGWTVTRLPAATGSWPVHSRRRPPAPEPAVDTPYLDVRQAAAYCRVAVKTLYNHRRHIERMPGVRKLVFKREALDRWLATRPSRRRPR